MRKPNLLRLVSQILSRVNVSFSYSISIMVATNNRASKVVVIPTFDEAESLPRLLEQLSRSEFDVLVVDDNSPDGTGEIAERYAQKYPNISVIHQKKKGGLGEAYRAGFSICVEKKYSWIIEMDADGSHRVEDLISLARYIDNNPGVDLLIGSRWIPGGRTIGWSISRRTLSMTANRVSKLLLRSQLSDLTSGFRVLSKSAAEKITSSEISSKGYGFQIESAIQLEKSGFEVAQLPITFIERAECDSKMTLNIIIEAIMLLIRLAFTVRK